MLRVLLVVSALLTARVSIAQVAAPASEMLIGTCVEMQPANAAMLRRWKAPLFARLEATQWRNYPNHRRMRVATPIGTALDSDSRRYEREANWKVEADSIRLAFSTGFTVVTFAFALTGSDTLHGIVNVWNDDGNTTFPGGFVTLSFPSCSRLYVP